ncbi:hypothetical protein LJB42_000684 [Komagataella kurtzmanii]|nr:hypothetical protein LJB42_000684 [Komagataella kurtzmanii]
MESQLRTKPSMGFKKGRKKDPVEKFITSNQVIVKTGLSQLRYMILAEGLTTHSDSESCPYRCYVWSILLQVPPTESEFYIELVSQGRSQSFDKILNDAHRTLKGDPNYESKVTPTILARTLNCYALMTEIKNENVSRGSKRNSRTYLSSPYIQGMNILMAPFLYVCKTEPQAFLLFDKMINGHMPLYVLPNLEGAHTGVRMVDLCLQIVDPKLHSYLSKKMLKTEIYAFPSVLTLSACTPPLSEVLELWDFLFSYGIHLNVLFIVAQLVLIRSELMKISNPMTLLREFPKLESKKIIKLGISFIEKIPKDVYMLLVKHTHDPTISEQLDAYYR